jgi:hypothetical protein
MTSLADRVMLQFRQQDVLLERTNILSGRGMSLTPRHAIPLEIWQASQIRHRLPQQRSPAPRKIDFLTESDKT